MKRYLGLWLIGAAVLCLGLGAEPGRAGAQAQKGPIGPVKGDRFHTAFVKVGRNGSLLYLPDAPGPNARIAIVYSSSVALYEFSPAAELASRGYRVLLAKKYLGDWRGARETPVDGFEETSAGIAYMRSLPGIERVVLMGHDEGGRMTAFYAAAAQQGPAICQNPGLVYRCRGQQMASIAKPDGLILLDPGLGAFHSAAAVDPSIEGGRRSKRDVDMYAASKGYNAKTGSAKYSAEFIKRFYAAQSARNGQIVDDAVARLKIIEQGKGEFTDDEPLTVPGAVNSGPETRLYDTDLSLLSHTKALHMVLKADGSTATAVVRSVRASRGEPKVAASATCCEKIRFTVRRFLGNYAIRTTPDFAVTADDILGVDWKSSNTGTPGNAEYIMVPTLVLTTTCSSFVVPGEIIYDHLAAKDKSYVAVEGAAHDFTPCKPGYGDTRKRSFDFVDGWLGQQGRF